MLPASSNSRWPTLLLHSSADIRESSEASVREIVATYAFFVSTPHLRSKGPTVEEWTQQRPWNGCYNPLEQGGSRRCSQHVSTRHQDAASTESPGPWTRLFALTFKLKSGLPQLLKRVPVGGSPYRPEGLSVLLTFRSQGTCIVAAEKRKKEGGRKKGRKRVKSSDASGCELFKS